uniref:Trafficking protein particle complex subunit n=1 Tax=Spongospora subterranea TaxID=70186 RepID=A0A0H5QGR7_9EUKA|eukprot:CRZ01170.1 hypothetical protein [Spongospora subterranea]
MSSSGVVSLSSLSLLFSEMVQYGLGKVSATAELEFRLSAMGERVGSRALDLFACRGEPDTLNAGALMRRTRNRITKPTRKRLLDVVSILTFIHTNIWQGLFDHTADRLEKSTERADEYYIYDSKVIVNRFISVPKEMGSLNCAAFVAGVIKGILDAADFPATVNAHYKSDEDRFTTIFVITFQPEVIQRSNKQQ